MSSTINYNIHFDTNGNQVTAAVTRMGSSVNSVDSAVSRFGRNFNSTINNIAQGVRRIQFGAALDQIDRVANGLNSMAAPGLKLSSSMYDLQAITGVAGDKLQEIEGYARSSAKTFGGDAAAAAESYKLVLSQLSPEIAKVPAALKMMGDDVAVLSKSMGGDTVAATETLTTAMNQFQVSLDDPIAAGQTMTSMMNVMAAAAKEGSAELPQIKAALEQAGMAAKGAGVSFEETNAAIQVLDKAGKKGSEGGVALRNMLSIMGQGRFMPKETQQALAAAGVDINKIADNSIPLAQRLQMLTPIMNDGALVTKLFGMENKNAAVALLSAVPEVERLTTAITGTASASEQAAIVMESPAEKASRLQAKIDDLKISLFNGTNGLLGYASVLGDATSNITNMMPAISLLGQGVVGLIGKQRLLTLWSGITSAATSVWSAVTGVLSATMWSVPIVWIVAAIIALIAVIAYMIYKTDGWGEMWKHVVSGAKLLWEAFTLDAKNLWDTMVNGIMIGLNYIKQGWYEFKNSVGIGESTENNAMLAAINKDTEGRKKAIIDGAKDVMGKYKAAYNEFAAGAHSLKWNNKDPKSELKKQIGIDTPTAAPGATGGNTKGGGTGGVGGGGAGAGKKSNDAIATGGTKNTTIHITIGKQIETLQVYASDLKNGGEQVRNIIVDELNRALAMAGALAD